MSELEIFAILAGIVLIIILTPNLCGALKTAIRIRRRNLNVE